jgi:predicted AAA+ superfamily ATPase
MRRSLFHPIQKDLQKKMVFLGGPRQVGKTTLAKALLRSQESSSNYFNWDFDEDRKRILKKEWDIKSLVALDEIHKYPKWKNFLKGIYDVQKETHRFLITGSARLDIYKRGGDSMLGMYQYWRLHPLTLNELPPKMGIEEGFQRLKKWGHQQESLLRKNER